MAVQLEPSTSSQQLIATDAGYQNSQYAASLMHLGTPYALMGSGGWLLARSVPGTDLQDLMGPYPLFACRNWSALHQDLAQVAERFVCAYLVTDPFGDYAPAALQQCFTDVCRPFKQHVVVDLQRAPLAGMSSHHHRYARKALRHVQVEICEEPARDLSTWVDLYENLVARRGIRGVAAFSDESFARQLQVPGLVSMRAIRGDATVGMVLWYLQGSVGYYHLGAYSEAGYQVWASFGIFRAAIEYFSGRLEWLNLGGAAGARTPASDGLARFKSGWSTARRTAYFCGRIFNRAAYHHLVAAHAPDGNYFPAYRAGEFK